MSKVVCIIQARMGSTRLPGKVLKDLLGKTVLQHLLERVRQSKLIDETVIATTENKQDDAIVTEAEKCGVNVFRGSEDDVLSRYYFAAQDNQADIIVRITSDCPLVDPKVIDDVIEYFLKHGYGIVTNAGNDLEQRTYPRGLDVEVFTFSNLKTAHENAEDGYQREHVTPYIYENEEKVYYYKNDVNYSNYRWTLDTEEDFLLIDTLYKRLYKGTHDFYFKDILKVLEQNPEISKINEHIEQKKLG